ncbi:MAG: CPBP family intramembrane metalloprotease [Oscillatoriales cyanobacterium SM2_2_1]|nr:CPBP family intramembrane metalloprotease [Oscillatoriales cyanobacterium SM2_2_1]
MMPPDAPSLSRTRVVQVIIVTAVLLVAIAGLWHLWLPVAITPLHWHPLALGMGLVLGVAITATSVLLTRIWPAYGEAVEAYLQMVVAPLEPPDLLILGLFPAASEELLFRGVALSALGNNTEAVLISGLVFGFLHLASAKHYPYVLFASMVGVVLGALTLLTANLVPAVTAHAVINIASALYWRQQLTKKSR